MAQVLKEIATLEGNIATAEEKDITLTSLKSLVSAAESEAQNNGSNIRYYYGDKPASELSTEDLKPWMALFGRKPSNS